MLGRVPSFESDPRAAGSSWVWQPPSNLQRLMKASSHLDTLLQAGLTAVQGTWFFKSSWWVGVRGVTPSLAAVYFR